MACQSDLSQEAVHEIDDLLARRMTVVIHQARQDESLHNKEKYQRETTGELEKNTLWLEYLQERYELLSAMKIEIDASNEDLNLMIEKYPKGKPGHTLIHAFKNYLKVYKDTMDAMVPDLNNQINTGILYASIITLETNQQLFFDALDNKSLQQAEGFSLKGEMLFRKYENKFEQVDFNGKISSEWATEFRDIYEKMHRWFLEFRMAKMRKDEALYKKLKLDSTELVLDIPHAKFVELKKVMIDILFDDNPDVDALHEKREEAGELAYTLYYEQKKELGEEVSEPFRDE